MDVESLHNPFYEHTYNIYANLIKRLINSSKINGLNCYMEKKKSGLRFFVTPSTKQKSTQISKDKVTKNSRVCRILKPPRPWQLYCVIVEPNLFLLLNVNNEHEHGWYILKQNHMTKHILCLNPN